MSFLADLVGNAALSGEKVLGDRIQQEQLLARQDHEAELAMARAKMMEELKVKQEKDLAQQKYQRMSENTAAIEAATPGIQQQRQVGEAQQRAPSVDSNVLDNIKNKLTPEQLSKYYGVQNTPVTRIDDQITAARKGGMYEMEAALRTSREGVVKQLKDERDADYKQGILDNQVNESARKEVRDEQRHKEVITATAQRAASGSGKKGTVGESVEKLTTQWNAVLRGKKDLMDTYGAKRAAEMPIYKQYLADEADITAALRDKRKKPQDAEDTSPTAAPAKVENWVRDPKTGKLKKG